MICSMNGCSRKATVRARVLGDIPLCEEHSNELYEVREKAYRKHNILLVENTQGTM